MNPAPHIVIVDDDQLFLRTLTANVERAGYNVSPFECPRAALTTITASLQPHACVFDWHMPEMSGLDLLQRVKAKSIDVPVMFLTGLNNPMLEEIAFDHGAIEFVEKTRSLAVILKRLDRMIEENARALSQAFDAIPQGTDVGPLRLDQKAKRAYWRGSQVSLSLTEFEITSLLANNAGRDISYREIYDVIQDVGFCAGRGPEGYRINVRAAIKRIRKKFAFEDSRFSALENYPGFGYRWHDRDESDGG